MSENGLRKIPDMRAALVAIQELHKPVLVGTRDGEPVYRCMTCISIEVPCKTRSLADRGLGEARG